MVTRITVDRTLEFLKNMPKKAVVTIDGIKQQKAFHSQVIESDKVKTYVYLEDGHGTVTAAELVDELGIPLDQYETNIEQSEDGLMIVFSLSIAVKGEILS